MTSRDFCYWLQGYFEIQSPKAIEEKELAMIKRHLNMVFAHEIDPSFDNVEVLRKIHGGSMDDVPITC